MLDHSFVISSFHAVKVDPETGMQTQLQADDAGYIELQPGDTLHFPHPQEDSFVALNAMTLHAGDADIKLAVNGNEHHALYVPAGATLGISSLAIYTLTALLPCVFRYEALA